VIFQESGLARKGNSLETGSQVIGGGDWKTCPSISRKKGRLEHNKKGVRLFAVVTKKKSARRGNGLRKKNGGNTK